MSIAKDLLFTALFMVTIITLLVLSDSTQVESMVLTACLFMITNYIVKYKYLKKQIIQQREYFINTLSHDLRVSTLAQIRGLDLLKNNHDNEELVANIKDSCQYTLDMITMLLNMYKFETGEISLNYEKFKLSEIVSECCSNLSEISSEKGVNISGQIENYDYIEADKEGVSKLTMCLISAALINADKNSTINVNLKKINNNFDVSISYKGVGLSEEDCSKMFSEGAKYSTVGHGIRMLFCKKITEIHGGKIYANNTGDGVNVFSFSLPVECQKAPAPESKAQPALQKAKN